jgi:DNA primase
MPRIPESELEQLKLQVSMVRLVEAAGIGLKPHGRDLVGRCPFHDDKTPSLVISPKSNLWHCLGACQAGGSVVDWVMRFENVPFRRAVELLKKQIGAGPVAEVVPAKRNDDGRWQASEDDAALLRQVIDYYHAALAQSAEAQAYLAKRGLDHPELVDHFRLGVANRTLAYQLPPMQVRAGAAIRGQLQRIGILRQSSGHEHLNGSLVVPVTDPAGNITEVYGRKIGERLRSGTPLHLYLPGPHRGVFNEAGLVGQEEAILCEALIDALTFWCAGYRNVTASYGIEGFTEDHLAAFHRHGVKRVLIAYDADEAGDSAADKLAAKLIAEGFDAYRCRFPKGSDANQYALDVTPASKSLGIVIRQAEWLGNGAAPQRPPVEPVPAPPVASASIPSLVAAVEATEQAVASDPVEAKNAAGSAPAAVLPEPPAYRVPPSAEPLPVEIDGNELRLALADRRYQVRGIDKNLSYEQLKVWIKVGRGDHVHVDTIELYQAKQRALWCRAVSVELGVSEEIAKGDLATLLRAVEQRQDEIIRAQLKPADAKVPPALTADEREAALALLRDRTLIERIVADVEASGVVGESSNALVAYLACVSRKLDKPLAILIQSTSAAGKSTLMDAILALMPEAERVHYSAMTGQSLFYLGEQAMKHKILAIAEEEGVRQAAYALKLLQSQGELTIASTGKDPITGQLVTQEYRVEGPVMLFLTTTAIDIDEELLNRCLVLTIDESREQTAAIQARQREARTLDGLRARRRANHVLAAHRAAQALLRPLAVVNPYAEQLRFAHDRVRLRRDQQKYLGLIDAIALLQQYQRPVRTMVEAGETIEYVEVTLDDIALANRLAHEVLGRSLDELPPHTRRLLGIVQRWVGERAQAQGITPTLVRFTRRELRAEAGQSDTQLRVHLDRLVELEYVIAHAGRNGQRFVYELAFDGDARSDRPQVVGLIDIEQMKSAGTTPNLAASSADLAVQGADLAGSLRAPRGELAASLRQEEMPRKTSADAAFPVLAAAVEENARPEPAHAPRRNGTSYLPTVRN